MGHTPGDIELDGARAFKSPYDAWAVGIETGHQNLALIEDLTVWQNLFLSREVVRRFGPLSLLNRRAAHS